MARLTWDNSSERYFETGISHAVLYLMNDDGTYEDGVAWNGLIRVSEKHGGGEAIHVYADGQPFTDIYEYETFNATIESYTYPDEFMLCDGFYPDADGALYFSLQDRKHFGLCYQTISGNDTEGTEFGHKLHILYDCIAIPSEHEWSTINDSFDLSTFSWDITTACIDYSDFKPTPLVVIDSTKITKAAIGKIESYLYGSNNSNPTLIRPEVVKELLSTHYLVTEEYEPIVFGTTRILV